jgi:hypothetical protein
MALPTMQPNATEGDKAHTRRESPEPIFERRLPMRQVMMLVLSPILAVTALTLANTYSSPAELWAAVQPVNPVMTVVDAGGHREEAVITDIARSFPRTVAQQPVANADCFQDLALADAAKLDRCATVVYKALIAVEQETKRPVIQQMMDATDRTRVVEQLKFAATEVCRNKWANAPRKGLLRSPACAAAEIQVALEGP